MSRINYNKEAAGPSPEVHSAPERVPFLLRDGTPLRRDKYCDACGWGNRPVAMTCVGCGHRFPKLKVRRESDSGWGNRWSWWDLLHLPDIIELCGYAGRIVLMIARGMVSVLKS